MGLLQPLLVERDGDKFRVVAGHRRRLACMALVEDGLAQFRRVPCVTRAAEEEGTVKTILDRLALIFANGFREKSDWEKMEETLRTEALIAELRKEVEVEGRTRWITAEFTGITEAQIGRYKSIKNNLCPEGIFNGVTARIYRPGETAGILHGQDRAYGCPYSAGRPRPGGKNGDGTGTGRRPGGRNRKP